MKSVTDSIHNLSTSLLRYPLVIISSIIVTRFLGPENKGLYAYLIMMAGVILPISFLGLGNGIQYYISNKKYKLKNVIISTLVAGIITGLFVSLLIFLLWKNSLFGESGNKAPFLVLLCFLIALPLDGLTYTARFLLVGDSQFKFYNYVQIANSLLSSFFLLGFVLFLNNKLLGAAIAVNVIKIVVLAYVIKFLLKTYRPYFSLNFTYLKEVYVYGLKSWLGNLSARANDQLDQLIIGIFVSPALLGIYSVSYAFVNLLLIPSNAISPVLFNEISKVNDIEKSAHKAAQVHRSLLIVVGTLGICLAIAGYWLIPFLYGMDFKDAYLPFLILLPGMIAYSVSRRVLQKILAANGFPLKTSLVQFIAAVTGVLAYLILIPKYNIIGAAIGSTIAYFTSMVVAYILTIRMVKGKFNFFKVTIHDITWLVKKIRGVSIKSSIL